MPYELHRSVLALCVTACLAYGTWPEKVARNRRVQPEADVEALAPPIAVRPDSKPGEPPKYVARTAD